MAKRRANRREKVATRNAKTQADVRRKTLRRRMGDIKRVELQLNADSARDQYIASHLNRLEYGTTSEFVRQAIEEKIAREIAPHENVDLRAMLDEVIAAHLSTLSITMEQAQRVTITATPEPENVTQSSGLNMDRPRKRPTIARTQPAQIAAPEPDELTEADSIRLGQLMAASIRKAQPGRPQ